MPKRNRALDELALQIPVLLQAIEAGCGLKPVEFRRVLGVHLCLVGESMRKQWLRWASGETVPAPQALHVVARTAMGRGWLTPAAIAQLGLKPLLRAVEDESAAARRAQSTRARAAASVALSVQAVMKGLDELLESSQRPRPLALQLMALEVARLVAERMKSEFGLGDIDLALDFARECEVLMQSVVVGIHVKSQKT